MLESWRWEGSQQLTDVGCVFIRQHFFLSLRTWANVHCGQLSPFVFQSMNQFELPTTGLEVVP